MLSQHQETSEGFCLLILKLFKSYCIHLLAFCRVHKHAAPLQLMAYFSGSRSFHACQADAQRISAAGGLPRCFSSPAPQIKRAKVVSCGTQELWTRFHINSFEFQQVVNLLQRVVKNDDKQTNYWDQFETSLLLSQTCKVPKWQQLQQLRVACIQLSVPTCAIHSNMRSWSFAKSRGWRFRHFRPLRPLLHLNHLIEMCKMCITTHSNN